MKKSTSGEYIAPTVYVVNVDTEHCLASSTEPSGSTPGMFDMAGGWSDNSFMF
jgi:hypothetical protein